MHQFRMSAFSFSPLCHTSTLLHSLLSISKTWFCKQKLIILLCLFFALCLHCKCQLCCGPSDLHLRHPYVKNDTSIPPRNSNVKQYFYLMDTSRIRFISTNKKFLKMPKSMLLFKFPFSSTETKSSHPSSDSFYLF